MALTKGLGIISTVKYRGTNLEHNFRTGVGHDAWCDAAPVKETLGYGDDSLNGAVDDHNADGNVGLIVTVGGVASARAARRRSTKPFSRCLGTSLPISLAQSQETFSEAFSCTPFLTMMSVWLS